MASEVALVLVIDDSVSSSVIILFQCEGTYQLHLSVVCPRVKVINSLINEEHEFNSTNPT